MTRFSVAPENEDAAIEHLKARSFSPSRVEKGEDGLVGLMFDVPEDQMHLLAQALPVHLSAKIGFVVGDQPPFRPKPSGRP